MVLFVMSFRRDESVDNIISAMKNQMGWRNSYSDNVNYHWVSTIKDSICYRGFEFAPIQKDYVESTRLKYNDKHELLFHPVLSDTIYHILSASKYTAKYVIKYPKSIWQKSNEWLSYDETTQLLKLDYKEVANFYEVKNYLIMSLSMYDKVNMALTSWYLLYDKRLEKGFFAKNLTLNVITNTCSLILNATFGSTCISSLNPYQLKCDLKRVLKIKVTDKQLSDIIMQSTENSNPIVVLYTFKKRREEPLKF